MIKQICILSLCALSLPLIAQRQADAPQGKRPWEALGGRTFVYGQEVRLPHPLSIDPKDPRPLAEILDAELQGTGITYRITRNHILLFAPAPQASRQEARTHTLYGYVIDQESKESLIGANVFVPIHQCGASANEFGHFSITLPEGETLVETSYIGYEKDARPIRLTHDTLITIALHPNTTLAEIVVDADRPETGIASSRLGTSTLTARQIMNTPALLGEADVLKALQYQPGVQTGMAGQVSMSVHGGDADQNLFLLDGMMLYNVDHVMGFESAFMPDAVKHVDFYRCSFPSRYGGRLSSVTDVRTKDGDMQQYHGTFAIGLLSSHLSLEGPIVRDRTSFIVSARRSYADWMLNAFKPLLDITVDHLGLYFTDVNAKVNHKLGDHDRLYLSFYYGRDVISVDDRTSSEYEEHRNTNRSLVDMHWGNTLYHARWNHIFTPKLFANLTVGYNRFTLSNLAQFEARAYRSEMLTSEQTSSLEFSSGIDDLSAMMDFDYHPRPSHHIRFGAQYTLHQFRPEVQSSQFGVFEQGGIPTNDKFRSNNDVLLGHESALYAEDDMTLGERWQVNAGLRASLFSTHTPRAFASRHTTYPALEPRLSACRLMGEGWRAKASYSLMHQYVHKITSSQIASPSDLWVPVTRTMKPMSAHQWATGVSYEGLKGWELSADAYWKEMYNVIDIIDGANFFGNSRAWETKVTSGRGRSYGVEFNVSRTTGRTTGMLNYTLAKTDRWFPNGLVNSGRHYPYRYDRRHVVHLLVQHQLTPNIELNAGWNFASGALTTVAKQQTEYLEPEASSPWKVEMLEGDYFSGRNNYRMAPTHQLDLGINIHHATRHGERIWNFSLMNAYCHLNQDMIYASLASEWIDKGTNPDGSPIQELQERRVLKQITVIPLLPSFTYTYKF